MSSLTRYPKKSAKRFTYLPRIEILEERCQPAVVDPILEWNAVMLEANKVDHTEVQGTQTGPNLTARAFAIVSAAMYDAYNSVESIGAKYLTNIDNSHNADSSAAVAQAARDTLVALYPHQQAAFDTALIQTLARVPNGMPENKGREVGRQVAAAILQVRASDQADSMSLPPYVPNGQPGFHDVDPLHPAQGFYAPDYATVTPFALQSADQFQARRLDDATPAGRLAFLQSAEYTAAYQEVMSLGGDGIVTPTTRTAEQTVTGIFWGYDGVPGLGTPPRLYNQIARVVANQEHNTVGENARLFALINIAMADAGLSAWNSKYDDDFWRPILGIRNGAHDANPITTGDVNWSPLGACFSNGSGDNGQTNFTPPFPAYISGHATFGAALFETLTRFYGTDHITFSVTSDEFNGVTRDAGSNTPRPVVTRTYTSFKDASFENAQSRIYLGIHWAFDRDDGIKTGNAIADYVYSHFLQPNVPTTLIINGTSGADHIALFADYVLINGLRTDFANVQNVVIFGGRGDDTFTIAANVNIPVVIFGDGGHDTVIGPTSKTLFIQGGPRGREDGSIRTRALENYLADLFHEDYFRRFGF